MGERVERPEEREVPNEVKEAYSTVTCMVTHGGINSECCKRCGKHSFDERFDAMKTVEEYLYRYDYMERNQKRRIKDD